MIKNKMQYFKQTKKYKAKLSFLRDYLKGYWFIPSDALQRGMEANIWSLCRFKHPVLDIGVGNGRISTFIFKKHPQIAVGIDLEEGGLEEARKTKKYKKILQANAEKMPFKNASFNTVVSNSTFEHIENDLKAISEVARVLKKDGLFFMTVPSEYLPKWILEYEQQKNKTTAKTKLQAFNTRTNHFHYRSLDEWKKHFAKNNLEIVFYKYYFPEEVALYWYKLFNAFTHEFRGRELWSYLGHSRISKVLPYKTIGILLEKTILQNVFRKGFFIESEGAQLFIIVKKV